MVFNLVLRVAAKYAATTVYLPSAGGALGSRVVDCNPRPNARPLEARQTTSPAACRLAVESPWWNHRGGIWGAANSFPRLLEL